MTPSRATGRKGRQIMWAVLNYDCVMNVGHTRRGVQDEIAHSRADWLKSRRQGYLRCVKVTVTWTLPTKPKPRKAK